MNVWSPKDGFVTKLHVSNGQHVTAGAPLLVMDTDEEIRHKERIEVIDKVRAEMASQYQGEEERVARTLADTNARMAKYKVENYQEILQRTMDQQKVGQMTEIDVYRASVELQQAKTDHAKAQADQVKLNFALQRHKRISDIFAAQLANEQKFYDKKIAKLTIIAPVGGTVKLEVSEKSFCALGDLLLIIE